ncbi:hypothetical protein [Hymenobacter sp. UYP22]|uniref:hypothetical protein n=1 Tax=Hymenobacter sp. UYP22 TaxID=3156348 RepID=UPI0033942430
MNIFINEAIHLDGSEWIADEKTLLNSNIIGLLKAIKALEYIPDSIIHYSGEGIRELFEHLTLLDSLNDYAMSNPIFWIRQLLYDLGGNNWNDKSLQPSQISYYLQINRGSNTPININNSTVAEIAEYIYLNKKAALVNLLSSEYNTEVPIHVNRSRDITMPEMSMIKIHCFADSKGLVNHINLNRIPRIFNLSPKHGQNGKGAISNNKGVVSVLECSKEEAQSLLSFAIGRRDKNELYSFDSEHDKFIVFKFEGNNPQNQHHGYHPADQSIIPIEIREYWIEEYKFII